MPGASPKLNITCASSTDDGRDSYASLHDAIFRWYDGNSRELPWRRTRDPYQVLVSEIMLQQTQVDRVLPKYEQFLQRFPTLSALADAPLSEVLRVWSPLGYNRRARYLHLAARAAKERFDGVLPETLADLQSLPGLGRYTAGAVACFAFEQQTTVVDTNVRRVLGRLILGERDGVSESIAWKLAEAVLPVGDAYRWNQALMDLGATICGAVVPQCELCPAAALCRWRRETESSGGPVRRVREARTEYAARPDTGAARRRWRGHIVNALRAFDHDDFVDWRAVVANLPAGHESDGVDLAALLASLVDDGLAEQTELGGELVVRLPH